MNNQIGQNTSLQTEQMSKALDASTFYLKAIDNAILEAENNLAKLRMIRGQVKTNILGENPTGLSKVLDDAGPKVGSYGIGVSVQEMENALKNSGD